MERRPLSLLSLLLFLLVISAVNSRSQAPAAPTDLLSDEVWVGLVPPPVIQTNPPTSTAQHWSRWDSSAEKLEQSSREEAQALKLMREGKWQDALACWDRYQPAGMCGNGQMGMKDRKVYMSGYCLLKMGRDAEALKLMESWLFDDWVWSTWVTPVLLVNYYRRHGNIDQFEARLKLRAEEINKQYRPENAGGIQHALDYNALLKLTDAKDIAALWSNLDDHPAGIYDGVFGRLPSELEWKCEIAARLLVQMPETTLPYARAQMVKAGGSPIWASVILGQLHDIESISAIEKRLQEEENLWCLQDYFYALSLMHDEKATAMIQRYAKDGTGNQQVAAQKILKRMAK